MTFHSYYSLERQARMISGCASSVVVIVLAVTASLCRSDEFENRIDLNFTSHNSKQIEVRYFDYNRGLGITMFSSKERFLVLTTNSKLLFCVKDAVYQEGDDLDQIVVIRGRPFLDHRRRNKASSYSINNKEADALMVAAELKSPREDQQSVCGDPAETRERVAKAVNEVVNDAARKEMERPYHKQELRRVINDLIGDPHIPVIIDLAISLGEKEKIIGRDYPPVLPFYSFARMVARLLKDPALVSKAGTKKKEEKSLCEHRSVCTKTCPPCKKKECDGLCGVGCSCWKMVCGDCCWQKGCCSHDECCRKEGVVSLACTNVLHFTCTNFKCPNETNELLQ